MEEKEEDNYITKCSDRVGLCPGCKVDTIHTQTLFDPDADEENKMLCWQCTKCNESLEMV